MSMNSRAESFSISPATEFSPLSADSYREFVKNKLFSVLHQSFRLSYLRESSLKSFQGRTYCVGSIRIEFHVVQILGEKFKRIGKDSATFQSELLLVFMRILSLTSVRNVRNREDR